MSALDTRVPAPVIALLAGLSMKASAVLTGIRIDPNAWRMQLGLALAQLSALIALTALTTLWRARTTIDPIHPERASRLITGGIYRLSRNPMYLSLLMLLAGYAVRLDAGLTWLGPLSYWAYVTCFQIRPEERVLSAKFGQSYRDYRRRTRRWL